MAEKRKPVAIILLKRKSKRSCKWVTRKLEIYRASDFTTAGLHDCRRVESLYRLRVDGKWIGGRNKCFYYKSDIRNMFFRRLKF
jgi:hypothetical protein